MTTAIGVQGGRLGNDWQVVSLGEVADVNPRLPFEPDPDSLASFVPMKCVEEETGRFQPLGDRRVAEVRKGYTPFRDGDVLFAKVTPCMENGKAAVMSGLTNGVGFGSTELFALRPNPGLRPKYLLHFLLQSCFRREAAQNMTGAVGLRRVPKSYLERQMIPLPPLPEQDRIVQEIERQFTRLEAGETALRRVQANLKRYRAAVLQAACEGRLVPTEAELARKEGRTVESGEALLARIAARRQGDPRGGKAKVHGASATRDLPLLPEGWTWAQFGHLGVDPFSTVQTGPFGAQLHNTEFTESGVPVIAVGNLTGTGFTTHGLYFVSSAKAKQLGRYDVWAGDVLFARSGATLGKVCVAPAVVKDWRMTGHILRARLDRKLINPKIAVYALAALPAVRKQVFGNVRGVTRPGFNTGLLESILIPVAPSSEQARIVAEVERRLSVVDELDAAVGANLHRAARLRQAILKKAFSVGTTA